MLWACCSSSLPGDGDESNELVETLRAMAPTEVSDTLWAMMLSK